MSKFFLNVEILIKNLDESQSTGSSLTSLSHSLCNSCMSFICRVCHCFANAIFCSLLLCATKVNEEIEDISKVCECICAGLRLHIEL